MTLLLTSRDIARSASAPVDVAARRVPALDGLRGLMTLFVLFSHYFVEVPHGLGILSVGWVAVIVFFVLSGYLVGRLILDKQEAGNFLAVFYVRRMCRTFPTYFLTVTAVMAIGAWLGDRSWTTTTEGTLPAWSYFVFLQNIFVISRDSAGMHWLSPTWTLALEEQFYIVVPLLFLLVPRRLWVASLIALSLAGVGLRAYGVFSETLGVAPLALIPTSGDVLCAGLLLAILVKRDAIDWARWSLHLRAAPIGVLLLAGAAQRLDGGTVGPWFQILQPTLIAVASALFILMLVKGAPEAARFESKILRFFGSISYAVYLTHLMVLGLMHGLILGAAPDFSSWAQRLVTVAALGVSVVLATGLTRVLEDPITAWGRGFGWRPARAVSRGLRRSRRAARLNSRVWP